MGEVYGLEKESVPAAKQVKDVETVPSSIALPVEPVIFCGGFERTLLEAIECDYDDYPSRGEGSGKVSGKIDEHVVDLIALLEVVLLWAESGDVGDVSEEALVVTRTIITAVRHEVPVFKKGYMELVCSFFTEAQSACLESEVPAPRLADQGANVGVLELNEQLLAGDSGKVSDMRKHLSGKEVDVAPTK